MANRGLFTILIVLLGLGLLFAGGINTTSNNATDHYTVTNESMTVDYTQLVYVDEGGENATYGDTVAIYNSSDVLLSGGGQDYTWYATNGSVDFNDTTATTSGETVGISYEYDALPDSNRAMNQGVSIIGTVLVFIVFLLMGQWLFDVVGDW